MDKKELVELKQEARDQQQFCVDLLNRNVVMSFSEGKRLWYQLGGDTHVERTIT